MSGNRSILKRFVSIICSVAVVAISAQLFAGKGGGKPGDSGGGNANFAFLCESDRGLFLTTIGATETLQLTRPKGLEWDTGARWSPDLDPEQSGYQGRIAYVHGYEEGTTKMRDLCVMNPDGSGKRVVQTYDIYNGPADQDIGKTTLAWSPNGKEIVFASAHDIMYALDVATGNTRVLFLGPGYWGDSNHLSNPSISPLGVMSFSYLGAIYLVDYSLDENGLMQVADSPDFIPITDTSTQDSIHDSRPSWSPDGTYLAFIRRDFDFEPTKRELVVYDVLLDEFSTVWEGLDLYRNEPTWSPDGLDIAFHSYPVSSGGNDYDTDVLILVDWRDPDRRQLINATLSPDQDEEFPEWNPGYVRP